MNCEGEKQMKKMIQCGLSVLMGCLLTGCASTNVQNNEIDPVETYGCDSLDIYNWGEFIGENIISNFESEFNVKVNYSLFASNGELYTKLMGQGNFDIIIPSDYMAERLILENQVLPIDHTLIPNMSNLKSDLPRLEFDQDYQYTVPYFWGNSGIVYDKTVIDPADVEKLGYDIFRSEKYAGLDIVVYDNERDAFMMALKALGYSMNTENPDEINEALQWLLEVDSVLDPAYLQDEVIDGMIYGDYVMANAYSGDSAYMLSQNENLAYFTPDSGTYYWVDSMLIPNVSECSKLAHEFINYTLRYETALDNSLYVGYSSPVLQVYEELSGENGDYYNNEAYTPRSDYILDEGLRYSEYLTRTLPELWIKVKNQSISE